MEENTEQRTQNKRLSNNLNQPQQIEMEENVENGEGKQRKKITTLFFNTFNTVPKIKQQKIRQKNGKNR